MGWGQRLGFHFGRGKHRRLNRRWRELLTNKRQVLAGAGTEQAVITHFDKAFGQDVLQKAMDEFFCLQRAELGLAGVSGVVTEGDLVIFQLDDAAVADGDAKDGGGQVLETP